MLQIVKRQASPSEAKNLDNLIGSFLKELDELDPNTPKKTLEICHVGKFLMLFNANFQIDSVGEQPDFIIKSTNNNFIGLEHEILLDHSQKKIEGSFEDIVKIAENKFKERFPTFKFLVNIRVNIKKKLNKKNKIFYADSIVTIVEKHLIHGKFERNDLVNRITCQEDSNLTFNSIPSGGFIKKSLKPEHLITAILKKESKRQKYINNTGLNQQWLLIVIGSAAKSSYEILQKFDENLLIKCGFNRIFILEDFNSRLFELQL
ncbi:hypothetical protein GCM10027284_09600 [Cyclobacterium sediminis]